jgi:hypothetical protein
MDERVALAVFILRAGGTLQVPTTATTERPIACHCQNFDASYDSRWARINARHILPEPRPLCCPILHDEPRHALEFAVVSRNERRPCTPRLAGDQHVVRTDRRCLPAQVGADVGGVARMASS